MVNRRQRRTAPTGRALSLRMLRGRATGHPHHRRRGADRDEPGRDRRDNHHGAPRPRQPRSRVAMVAARCDERPRQDGRHRCHRERSHSEAADRTASPARVRSLRRSQRCRPMQVSLKSNSELNPVSLRNMSGIATSFGRTEDTDSYAAPQQIIKNLHVSPSVTEGRCPHGCILSGRGGLGPGVCRGLVRTVARPLQAFGDEARAPRGSWRRSRHHSRAARKPTR